MAPAMKRSDEADAPPFAASGVFRAAVAALVVVVTVAFSASGAASAASGAFDDDVIRVVGLGWTGLGGALDRLAAAPAMLLPIGTRALRAALATSLVAGACAWAIFDVAERFAAAAVSALWPDPSAEGGRSRLVVAVAGAAALAVTLGPGFQRDAAAPGGAALGALVLVLLLREVALALGPSGTGPRPPALAMLVGLAATAGLATFAAAALVGGPALVLRLRRARADRAALGHALAAFAVGLAPLVTSLAVRARAPELAISGGISPVLGLAPSLATGAVSVRTSAVARGVPAVNAFLVGHVGPTLIVCAGVAAVLVAWTLRRPGARREARAVLDVQIALAALAASGAVSAALFAGATPARSSDVVLAASAAIHAQAAVTLAVIALGIARAPVPFAQASAALVVVLELVVPVRSADDAIGQRLASAREATSLWSEVAFDGVAPASVVLVGDRSLARRLVAARATGDLRGDVLLVPADDVRSRVATRALAVEPKLAPLYRDLALGSPPEELSLTQLASTRPVALSFDPTWDRALARHLVPAGLFTRFDAEPRGAVDRRKAFDATGPTRDRLVRGIVAKKDAELVLVTAKLLRARALGVAATSDRELLSRALDDLRPFAPDDPVSAQLVRRTVTSKGAIDIRDLAP